LLSGLGSAPWQEAVDQFLAGRHAGFLAGVAALVGRNEDAETTFQRQPGRAIVLRIAAVVRQNQPSCPLVISTPSPAAESVGFVRERRFKQQLEGFRL